MMGVFVMGAVLLGTMSDAAGKPPGQTANRVAEWRELDPVARDHFLSTSHACGEPSGDTAAIVPTRGVLFLLAVYEELLNRMTIPLGTVPMNPSR
jgi:hypothetical protein